MKTLLRVVAALAVGAAATFLLSTAAGADPAASEGDFLARINQLRAENGVAPLAHDGQMADVGRRWSGEMARTNELHHNPNLKSEVHNWRIVGENVGVGSDVPTLQRAFENSPRHRENMLNPKYTHAGIGVVEAADGRVWVTEVFKQTSAAAPKAAAAPVAPAPPKPPAPPRVRVTTPPRPKPAPAPVVRTQATAVRTMAVPTTVAPAPQAPVAPTISDGADELIAAPTTNESDAGRAVGVASVLAAVLLGGVVSAARRPVFALRATA